MKQQMLNIQTNEGAKAVGDYTFEPIRGQPMLHWAGKRPFTATQYFPAQKKDGTYVIVEVKGYAHTKSKEFVQLRECS